MYFSPSTATTGEVEGVDVPERFPGDEKFLPLSIEADKNISPCPVPSSTHTILTYDSSITIFGEVDSPVLFEIFLGKGKKYLPAVDFVSHISPMSAHTT